MSFLRWLVGSSLYTFVVTAYKFIIAIFVLACGFAAVFLSGYIIEFFDLDDNSGMYLKLGLFVVIVGLILWADDKYKEWRFYKDD